MGREADQKPGSLLELARIYLRFGLTAFGGPAAHIAMMHREFVEQRRWLTEPEFVDLLGAVNLIPGPNSTQMAIFIGRARAADPRSRSIPRVSGSRLGNAVSNRR